MLPGTRQGHSAFTDHRPLIPDRSQWKDTSPAHFAERAMCRGAALKQSASSTGDEPEPEDSDAPLEDAARGEREYVRQRLREELQRDPTEEELDEWLRQQTEGY